MPHEPGRKRVVIVGAGFGGLEAAKALRKADVDVVIIDRSNHHLFQPLLYQVATAGLSPAEIAMPIRAIVRKQKNAQVRMAEVVGVDTEARQVLLREGDPVPYDYLILATGATHGYFGRDDWAKFAPGLKTLDDATSLRRNILLAFENAENNPADRDRWLTFVVIGGGPTGVEMAGAIAELARRTLNRDFDNICPDSARIILVEAGLRLLAALPENLSTRAKKDLESLGVEVRLGSRVTDISQNQVQIGAEVIAAGCIVWAAGVRASPVAKWLNIESDSAGRVNIDAKLHATRDESIFVIGDATRMNPPLPGTAPAAMQQGRHVAKIIHAHLENRTSPGDFRYFDKGNLATIGRSKAVGEFRGFTFQGLLAWAVWLFIHIAYLIGFKNRVLVLLQWAWSYITWERGARLITGVPDLPPGEPISSGRRER